MSGLTEIIADIMLNDENARNSDIHLYHAVCKKIAPAAMSVPFGVMIENLNHYGLPTYDTVTRLRRKIQSEYNFIDLQANTQVKAWRESKEERCRAGCFE
ncbi:MAG: hypothetical protein J6S14_22880 [Clostridia bacterium]|nr:hypothetical protein [Clostridia bacterium]